MPDIPLLPKGALRSLDRRQRRGLQALVGRVAAASVLEGKIDHDLLLNVYLAGVSHGFLLAPLVEGVPDGQDPA